MLPEPIPARLEQGEQYEPILLLGVLPDHNIMYLDAGGELWVRSGDDCVVVTDYRYNAETKEWFDVNGDGASLVAAIRELLGSDGFSSPGEGEDGEFGAEITLSLGEYRRLFALLRPGEVASE